MIERILLAVSETGHAEEMLKVLKELPSSIQQDVTVLHVVPASYCRSHDSQVGKRRYRLRLPCSL